MSTLRAQLRHFAAPVEYRSIRPWLQTVRAIAAAIVLTGCLVGMAIGLPHAAVPAAATAAVVLHAVTRGRRRAGPTESLLVDALAVVVGLGGVDHAHMALVGATAYLTAGAITFGGLPTLVLTLTTYGSALALRALIPLPAAVPLPSSGEPMLWLATAVFLGGVGLSLMAAARAVSLAREKQHDALTAERRASEMKNEFVSMVTHELRTPLTNIAGFAMTMQDTWKDLDPAEADEFLRIIVSEAEHLGNLVEDVLTIPRLEAGRLLLDVTDFALQPSAYRIADLLFPAGTGRSASVAIGGSVRVHADPNRVEQVLRNLLENARKYGGDQVSVEATRRQDEWLIVVADNGPGVPPAHRERIFTAFEQVTAGDARTDSGFGLGLAVARNLVEAMGGRIWYEPGFPVGARFCFTLPAAGSPSLPVEAVA